MWPKARYRKVDISTSKRCGPKQGTKKNPNLGKQLGMVLKERVGERANFTEGLIPQNLLINALFACGLEVGCMFHPPHATQTNSTHTHTHTQKQTKRDGDTSKQTNKEEKAC